MRKGKKKGGKKGRRKGGRKGGHVEEGKIERKYEGYGVRIK